MPATWSTTPPNGQVLVCVDSGELCVAGGGGVLGQLTRLPTLAQFDAGASVPGWTTVNGDQLTLFSSNYQYLDGATQVRPPEPVLDQESHSRQIR